MDIESFVKTPFAQLGATELLTSPVDALHGTTAAQAAALRNVLGIGTVFDLAASQLLNALRGALQSPAPRLAGDVFNAAAAGNVPLADAPLAALRAAGPAGAAQLQAALGVSTLGELAAWPPALAARDLLAAACLPEQAPGFDPEAPADLVPRVGEHATDKVFYKTLLIDAVAPLPGVAAAVAIETADPIDLGPVLGAGAQFQRVATGALLTFSQSWFAQGVALGQLLHSLSLAPGESTRMAMIDWSRQSSGRGREAVDDSERLANTTTHQRALSEVTQATAQEVQGGSTRATADSSTSQGGSSLGFELGPFAFGSSSGSSGSTTEAMTVSSSFGRRDLAASTAQQINDVSRQQASAARSRRASVVRELSQSEHESLSTRVVCNYNHMHTLNVQYYEVVQAFRVTTRLERADRVIFVPIRLLDFDDAGHIVRFRNPLAAAALDEATRQRIALFGSVLLRSRQPRRVLGLDGRFVATVLQAVGGRSVAAASPDAAPAPAPAPAVAPAGTVRAKAGEVRLDALRRFAADGWDRDELRAAVRCGARPIVTRFETALVLPADTLVSAVVLSQELALAIEVTRRDGSIVPLVEPGATGARFVAPEALRDLASISLRSALLVPREATLTLQLNLQGTVSPVGVPLALQAGGPLSPMQRVVSFDAPPDQAELVSHLKANALHYTQAVMRSLDETVLSALLARLSFGGVPLAQWVDHRPVAVTANYFVFKAGLPARGDPPDPALAALTTTWQQFLATAGVVNAAPSQQLMLLPTGGVFAEAVLGRSVSAERLDSTRFFDWQESPIPLVASDIAPLEAGSRAEDEDASPTGLSAPVVNIQAPTALPDPTSLASVLGALGAANLFRDLTGADATLALARSAQKVSAAGATSGGALAAQTLKTVMEQNTERKRIAAKVAAAMLGVPTPGGGGGGGKADAGQGGSNTVAGGLENRAKEIDQATAGRGGSGASGGSTGGARARPAATELQQRQSGADAIGGAGRIVATANRGTQAGEGGGAGTASTAPAAGPRRLALELRTSASMRDTGSFDGAPIKVDLQVQERDGTKVLERNGLAASGVESLAVTTASPTLFCNGFVAIDTDWPVPTRQVTNRFVTVPVDAVKNTLRLSFVAEVATQAQVVGAGPNPPSDAELVARFAQLGIDTRAVLKKPVVAKNADGSFVATFPQLVSLRLEFNAD